MDGITVTQKNSRVISASFHEEKNRSDDLVRRCRNLISVLSWKIETLCHECGEDPDLVRQIRSLTASLITLNSLLSNLEQEQRYKTGSCILEDTRGIRYISVTNCDLERWFREK